MTLQDASATRGLLILMPGGVYVQYSQNLPIDSIAGPFVPSDYMTGLVFSEFFCKIHMIPRVLEVGQIRIAERSADMG